MVTEWKGFAHRLSDLVILDGNKGPGKRRPPSRLQKWLSRSIPKLRLSHQLLGFFVVVVLFPLLILSLSIYSINQRAVTKQVASFTEHTAEAIYEELTLEMAWQKQQAQLAGELWESIQKNPSEEDRNETIAQFFASYPDFEAVAFVGPDGNLGTVYRSHLSRYSALNLPEGKVDFGATITFDVNYHKRVADQPDLTYSLLTKVPNSKLGIKAPGGMIFLKRFPYMGHLVKERFKSFKDGFVVADKYGEIIAGPPKLLGQTLPKADLHLYQTLQAGVMKEYATSQPLYSSTETEGGLIEGPKLEKVFIKVPSLGWGLVIESPYQIQTKFIQRARAQSVALVFLCILIIILLGIFYSQGINRNFRQLIKGIKALAEGRYSRKIRLITKSWTPYEIIYLTAEFNRMATKISSAWTNIQQLNQELVNKNQQDLFIAQATQRLHNSLELQMVCQTATEIFTERPEISGACLMLLSPETGRIELAAKSFQIGVSMPQQPLQHVLSIAGEQALQDQMPAHLTADALTWLDAGVTLTVQPIFYQENPIGVLALLRKKPETEGTTIFENELIIQLLSNQIGVAIHQARQWMQLQVANIQLAKLDELKSNLIDTVSHELRTPLTNIKGYTSRLIRNEDSLDSETKIKSLKVIKQQADRLGRLVEDLLVIPDLERQGGIRVFPDQVNLLELITRCVGFIQEKANREIEILACPNLDVLVDPDRMEQVLLNLLDNAIKYSYDHSVIEVRALQTHPDMAQIQIFNHCDPISNEDLAQLFTKFKRLDERLTRTTRGTGLGLFITKGLIEAMGGAIRLEGEEGFRVLVDIPLYGVSPEASEPQATVSMTSV